MKKRGLGGLLAVGLLAGLLLPASVPVLAAPPDWDDPDQYDEYTLFAGQDIDVGVVKVANDEDCLYVKYETEDPWIMTETHLQIGCDLEDFPLTKNGSPKVGQFECGDVLDPPSYEWESPAIPLPGDCDGDLIIGAHAVVLDVESMGTLLAIERGTVGDVYQIRVYDGVETNIGTITDGLPLGGSSQQLNAVNGFAFDYDNGRLYYANNDDGKLYFFSVPGGATTEAGLITGNAADASYYDGNYYYVDNLTYDLHEVVLLSGGKVDSDSVIATLPTVVGKTGLSFGDIAIATNGLVYMSTRYDPSPWTYKYRFCTFDMSDPVTTWAELGQYAVQRPQLALAGNADLYACDTAGDTPGRFYSVDETNGALAAAFEGNSYNDLASGFLAEPRTETAWAATEPGVDRFVDKGNWATYFEYELQPVFVETIVVPSDGTVASSVNALESGENYKLVATGTYMFTGVGALPCWGIADAKYSKRPGTCDWLDGAALGSPYEHYLQVVFAGAPPLAPVGWVEDYNEVHKYTALMLGGGSQVSFQIWDNAYGDNSGSLSVEIWWTP